MNIQKYSISLLLSFERNKTTSAVSRESGESQSTSSRFLKSLSVTALDFVSQIKNLFGNNPINLVTDDFVISRRYSRETEGTSSMVDQSTKGFTNGIKIVASGLTDGRLFLPIDFAQWVAQFIMGKDYLTTTQVAEKLVTRILELSITIRYFVFDGLYFSENFIQFLDGKNLKFIIKAKTTTSVIYKGQKMQLRNCHDLRLNNNQNQKKIKAIWCGKEWYFIAIRRTGKHGEKVIYLIANFEAKSKIYRKAYDSRWTIEKFIRTGKQSLGLKDSGSQEAVVYLNHIRCVFFAYTILQFIMKKFRLKSPEEAIEKAQAMKRKYKFDDLVEQFSLLVNHA
jgi:hypothetical protein